MDIRKVIISFPSERYLLEVEIYSDGTMLLGHEMRRWLFIDGKFYTNHLGEVFSEFQSDRKHLIVEAIENFVTEQILLSEENSEKLFNLIGNQ